MTLNKLAIHQIHRTEGAVQHKFSQSVLNVDDGTSQELYSQLIQAFDRASNPVFASFENNENVFPSQFNTYIQSDQRDRDFLDFNHNVLEQLKVRIEKDGRYKGGFFIFAEVDRDDNNFVDLFFVRDKKAVNFTWANDHFDIKDLESFDTDKLVMSCQIDIARFTANNLDRCINFYTSDTKERKFFYSWLSAAEFETSQTSTRTVIGVLQKYPPKDRETDRLVDLATRNPLEDEGDFDYQAYERLIMDALDPEIEGYANIRAISERIYEDERKLEENLALEEKDVPREFIKHKATIDHLEWVNQTAEKITLKFPTEVYNDKVTLERLNGELTGRIFVTSMELVNKISERMVNR